MHPHNNIISSTHLDDALLPNPAALTLLAATAPPDVKAAPLKSSPPVVLVHEEDSTTGCWEKGADGLAQSGSPYWPLMVALL